MRDNVFDVPIGLLREFDAAALDTLAANGRLMFTGVAFSEPVSRLLCEGDALVGRCLVVSCWAMFGRERFGSVVQEGHVFGCLSDALDFVDWHCAADMSALYDLCAFGGRDYEVWHVVTDPVMAPVPAAGPVSGSSRAASASAVLGALPGEHDGVFDVTLDQFETWKREGELGLVSDVLTWYPDRDDWVCRSRGVCVHASVLVDVRVGDWFRVYTSAAFGCPALDVWAVRIPDDAVAHVLETRDNSCCLELLGLGLEVECWHIVEDPLPEWVRLPGHDGDSWYWDERPAPQPVDTWYEIDLGPEVV